MLTVPSSFNATQRKATEDAAQIAGLDIKRVIDESVAATISAGLHNSEEEILLLVLNFGTFSIDISVMSCHRGVINVENKTSLAHLGSRSLDEAMAKYCLDEFNDQN